MRLTWLADECRAAGLIVVEVPGWQQRGPDLGQVGAVLAHHTATSKQTADGTVDRLLRDGRPGLRGPLAQVGLDRQGRVRLIAAGRANHAGAGSWRGVTGNGRAVGVEAYNDGRGEPWPPVQLRAWDVLNGVLLRRLGLPADRLCGHREWAPSRKTDPQGLDMQQMRARAAVLLAGDDMTPEQAQQLTDIHRVAGGLDWITNPPGGEGQGELLTLVREIKAGQEELRARLARIEQDR